MTNNNFDPQNQIILIVDDDASIRMTAAGILNIQGYSTLEADSAEACLNICQQYTPDLILLDAVMPGMDGFTCCLKLKNILGIQCPPIFMMTAFDDRDSIYRSFDVGITDYLVKPLNWKDLPEKIQQANLKQAQTKKLKQQFEDIYSLREKLYDSVYCLTNKSNFDYTINKT
jgi:PleD family two-component response regulator